jgi:hypothetical protein
MMCSFATQLEQQQTGSHYKEGMGKIYEDAQKERDNIHTHIMWVVAGVHI